MGHLGYSFKEKLSQIPISCYTYKHIIYQMDLNGQLKKIKIFEANIEEFIILSLESINEMLSFI